MRYFIAGGGCYGSYYVQQLDRARARGKLVVDEIIVVDRDPHCAVAPKLPGIAGARLEVGRWEAFGEQVWRQRDWWANDMWVPTPIGPHIIFHWVMERARLAGHALQPIPFAGPIPSLPYARTTPTGTLVLSHAPGVCPVNCVEPVLCPLTKAERDWEMRDTVRDLIAKDRAGHGIEEVGVFVCQHHAHGVGTIPMKLIFDEWDRLEARMKSGKTARLAVATVSSCHGILDAFELSKTAKIV